MDSILVHPETSTWRALILRWDADGTCRPLARRAETVDHPALRDLYRNDPDAGIHGAAEWTLRKWGQAGKLECLTANCPA